MGHFVRNMVPRRGSPRPGSVAAMLRMSHWHTWAALALAILLIGFVLHQIANRVPAVKRVVTASFGS